MKSSDNHTERSWAEDRVEAYVDGLLPLRERKVFEAMMREDPALAEAVGAARALQGALRDLPKPECPPAAYQPVLELARRQSARPRAGFGRSVARRPWVPLLTPVRAFAMAAVVIAIVAGVLMADRQAGPPGADAARVDEALQEVKLALSYVSLAGRETGHAIRVRAVEESIIGPVRRAIDQADIGSAEAVRGDEAAGQTKRGES